MAQILFNGFVTGLLIAVLALGFFVVYLSARVFHVALGGVYVVAPLVAWSLLRAGWHPLVAGAAALAAGVGLSVACELASHRGLERRSASANVQFVASLGLYLLISQGAALVWGTETKVLRSGSEAFWNIGAVTVTSSQSIAGLGSLTVLALFGFWLKRSGSGLRFRAMASNPREAMLRGQNVENLRLLAFAWSGFLGAVSALLTTLDLGFSSEGGLAAVLLAVVASILGARERFIGPVVGGLALGLIRAEAVWLLSARWQDAVTFLTLVVLLVFRPYGLLSETTRLEAES